MASSQDPRVQTSSGVVRGRWRGNSAVFLGIPYAAAPIGGRRFGPPEPTEPWPGERDAGQPGATPQRRPLAPVTTIPEPSISGADTLNLNVYTAQPTPWSGGLPVLVWIHGGGFVGGSRRARGTTGPRSAGTALSPW